MADILATFYGFDFSKEKCEDEPKKYNPKKTRSLESSKGVINYASSSLYDMSKCIFFQKILQSKFPSMTTNNEGLQNFVCNMFFPLPMVGSIVCASRLKIDENKVLKGFPEPINFIEEKTVGSTSEGLSLPEIWNKGNKSIPLETPDDDKLYILSELRIGSDQRSTKVFAFLETSPDSSQLYVRLKYNNLFYTRDGTDGFDPSIFVTNDGYIHRMNFIRFLRIILKEYVRNYKRELDVFKNTDGVLPDVKFSQKGPAITVDIINKSTHLKHSKDYVISLPCTKWPKQARQWAKRERHWPGKDMIKLIVQNGCHVVAKAHTKYKSNARYRKCKSNETEFILSFSPCDKILSHSLTLNQRRCYMVFKYIFKYHMKRVKRGLSNYMCKLTFFWLCEKKRESEWKEDNPIECLMSLMVDFKHYLTTGYLPHYYIPEQNLMSNMTEESRKACIRDVDTVMERPCEIMLDLSENYRFTWLSRDISIKSILQDLLSDVNITYYLLQSYILQFLSLQLDKGEILLVMAILCEIWSTDKVADTQQAISVLERLVCIHGGNEHIVSFKGLLAVLYHQRGEEYVWEENIRDYTKMRKSLDLFNEILDNVGQHIWIYGAYYDVMLAMTRYEGLVKHFLLNVYCNGVRSASKLYEPGIYTVLTLYNSLTTYIDDFNGISKMFVVPSTAYILYKVIFSYKALAVEQTSASRKNGYENEARKVLIHLQKWVKQKCQLSPEMDDELLYYMIGSAATELGDVEIAKNSFQTVVKYGSTFAGIVLEDEPEFHKSPEQIERYHPYLRKHRTKRITRRMKADEIPLNMVFRCGEVYVGSFSHFF